MRIGYLITITGAGGSLTIDSSSRTDADLISLMTTNDSDQPDYSLDVIIGNKDRKYNYRVLVGDLVTATLKLLPDDSDKPIYSKDIFYGVAGTVNWDYATMHLIANGAEGSFSMDCPARRRTYLNRASLGDYLEIVEDLKDDYNEANKLCPIAAVFPLIQNPNPPKKDLYEVQDGQHIETVMDDITAILGCTYWTDVIDGEVYLFLGDKKGNHSTEVLSQKLGANLIYDSAAVNEIGFVNDVVVHGSVQEYDADDNNLQGTRTCWGRAQKIDPNGKIVRHIDLNDPTCHTPEACAIRAKAIVEASIKCKDNIKPVFVNVAPAVGTEVSYSDPTYGIEIKGNVIRRELRVSATEGWICTVELSTPTGVDGDITLSSAYD